MEILIFSDSHGRGERMAAVVRRQIKKPDEILFAGDGWQDLAAFDPFRIPVQAVTGNCDGDLPGMLPTLLLERAGHRIMLTHGHRFGVKSSVITIAAEAARVGADIVIFGHTHEPYLESFPVGEKFGSVTLARPLYLFNPGSIGTYDWDAPSFGTLSLNGDTVLFSHGAY